MRALLKRQLRNDYADRALEYGDRKINFRWALAPTYNVADEWYTAAHNS